MPAALTASTAQFVAIRSRQFFDIQSKIRATIGFIQGLQDAKVRAKPMVDHA